jgi:hypothetical protein
MKTRGSVALALIALLAFSPFAWAIVHDVEGYSWGSFSNPQGFWPGTYSTSNGDPTSTFEWGAYACWNRSTLTFNGYDVGEDLVDCEAAFKVGKLTFCNDFNIYDWCGNSGTLDLTVNLHLDNPAAPDNPYEFDFNLGLFDVRCASDYITIGLPDPSGELEFQVDDTTYFMSIAGFYDACGQEVDELIAREPGFCCSCCCCNDCDTAWLYAQIRCEDGGGPSEVVPEPATCLLLGTGLIPLAIRRWKKARKA